MKIKALLALFLMMCATMAYSQMGNVGKPPAYPTGGIINATYNSNMTVINGEPKVNLFVDASSNLKATISFKLLKPTTSAKLLYGIMEPDNHRPRPRFRSSTSFTANAAPDTLTYSATINLTSFLAGNDPLYTYKANGGGVITYRIQVWSQSKQRLESYMRRFAYKGTMRVPCIMEGPFLTMIGKDNATIWFDTDSACVGRIVSDKGTFSDNVTSTHHEILLTGLTAGTRISYHAEAGDNSNFSSSATMSLKTQSTVNYFKFAHMSDSREGVENGDENYYGVNAKSLNKLGLDALNKGAELIIFPGDHVNGYSSDSVDMKMQYRAWKNTIEPFAGNIMMVNSMGNHEWIQDWYYDSTTKANQAFDKPYPQDAQTLFSSNFVLPKNGSVGEAGGPPYGETSYYYDYQNCRFIAVNDDYWATDESSSEKYGGYPDGYIGNAQLAFIKATVEAAQSNPAIDHVFLYFHEPPFPNGGHVEDCMWWYGGDPAKNNGINRQYIVDRRDSLIKIVTSNSKVLAILNGHEHNYSRLKVDNTTPAHIDGSPISSLKNPIWCITSGGCGAPYYNIDNSTPGTPWKNNVAKFSIQSNFCLFTVNGGRVNLECWSQAGELIDTVTLRNGTTVQVPEENNGNTQVFSLHPISFPNPGANSVNISYSITFDDHVLMIIYDSLGNVVNKLINEDQSTGDHQVIWNTENMPSGTYYCKLYANGNIATDKIVIVK